MKKVCGFALFWMALGMFIMMLLPNLVWGVILTIIFQGDGFLYHMIRILVGTLLEVGEGKRSPDSMEEVLKACNRQAAGPLAPAEGLTLEEVFYQRS